jgi:phosphatidate cytidylyltransferase
MLKRLITAAILLPLVVFGVIKLPTTPFIMVSATLFILASWEFSRLAGWESLIMRLLYVAGIIAIESIVLYPLVAGWLTLLLYQLSLIFWPLILILVLTYPKTAQYWGQSIILRSLMGYLALTPCFFILVKFGTDQFPREMLLFCLILIWGADSGAYFVGRGWGKTSLIPTVSPGKTVAGLMGALLTGLLIVFMVFVLSEWIYTCTQGKCQLPFINFGAAYESLLTLMTLTLWTILASVLGDLTVSMLKRNVGVKDTGQLLPGHGGILDRIDSMLPALPIFVHFSLFN